MRKIAILLLNDLRNIIREPMMIFILIGPALFAILFRFLIPTISKPIYNNFGVELTNYYPLITTFALLMSPMLMGIVSGFIILDEKDDNVLMTLITSPLAKNGYLLYRVLIPALTSFIYTFMILPILNLSTIPFYNLFLLAVMIALEAPFISLFLGVFAGNKVEGLALSKGLGILFLAPLAVYFIHSKIKFAAGIIPFFWPAQLFSEANNISTEYYLSYSIGFAVHYIFLRLMVSKFKKIIF